MAKRSLLSRQPIGINKLQLFGIKIIRGKCWGLGAKTAIWRQRWF